MISQDPIRLVQALIQAGSKEHIQKLAAHQIPPVVTISRLYGAGGRAVGTRLAKHLHVNCYDREILDHIVEKAGVDRYLMEQLDEHVSGHMSGWLFSVLTGKSVFAEDYRRHLVNVILAIAERGGVIIGRAAHLILRDQENVLRVRLVCSRKTAIERVKERDNLGDDAALRRLQEVDHERDIFVRALFHSAGTEAENFDLVINTDRLDFDSTTSIIIAALEKRGAAVPAGEKT